MTNNDNDNDKITMNGAVLGLMRFFRDCKPHRITWGIIFRSEFSPDGVRRLDSIIRQLKQNSALAQAFLDNHRPNSLERQMVLIFQESTEGYRHEARTHRDYINRCLEEERSIEERIEAYEQASMYIPPLRQERDDPPF